MKRHHFIVFWIITGLLLPFLLAVTGVADVNTTAPSSPVKLVFIHHSTGGNWLAQANMDQPYGELADALMANNYYVSATNYGWGPDGIGDRTDIINWPEWFTGTNSATIMAALYTETGQNFGGLGNWERLSTDPGGENQIVMLKSCFPNSDLFGDPTDTAGLIPDDQFTVSNAKAVYNNILTYFQAHQDKLFIVVTAPPLLESDYTIDYQTAAQRAANARALNNWLVNDWLDSYLYDNVGIFDYFNVLTGPNNHHRVSGGVVEHVTTGTSNFAYYPSYDSHPSTIGHQKATAEFVDLLNYYYNRWKSGDTSVDDSGGDSGSGATGDYSGNDGSDINDSDQFSSRIMPTDFEYRGAFRLPGTNDDGWQYSGGAMTWYPQGDSSGTSDGYPGSIFGTGFNVENRISEISIPIPVISVSKNLSELNTAMTLQGFTDLKGSLAAILDTPPQYAGIAWLPAQGNQTSGKLYLTFGQHFQDFFASHLWCDTNLSAPNIAGPWKFGDYTNYVTNDYLFAIPESFAMAYTGGKTLASGRHREGVWGGLGPTLFAASPWTEGNPPATDATLSEVTTLLLYGEHQPGVPEIATTETRKMKGYSIADYWSGGAWLTAGSKSALAFIGTKALGRSWYGFANGVVWEYDCADTGSCPEVPDWPYDNRGFWAESYEAQIILYDPMDLAAVATGTKQTWDPQPYATINLTSYLFNPNIDVTRYRRHLVGAMAFDDVNGLLYFFELLVDEDKSLVHVFKINSTGSSGSVIEDGASDDSTSGDITGSDEDGSSDSPTDNPKDTSSTHSGETEGGCFIYSVFRKN